MQTNEKPQHTPGPWRTVPSTIHPAANHSIRLDIVTDGLPFSPSFIAGDMMPNDARLIAAAPDMLEALQFVARGGDRDDTQFYEIAARARAAIAKAQGAA